MRPYVVLLCLLATLGFGSVAGADDDRFERLVTDATSAFGNGEFERAIELAEQAYAIRPDARLLSNIARAHEALGNLKSAIDHYERFLKADPATKDREVVKGRILALGTTLAERLRLEGERLEASGQRARAQDAYEKYLAAWPKARDRAEIERRIRDLEKPAPAPSAALKEAPRARSRVSVWPWVTLGVGVAVVATGGLFAVVSRGKYDDAEQARDGESTVALQKDGDRYTDFANVGFVAGGVLVVGGVAWLLLSPNASKSKPNPRVSLVLGLSQTCIAGSF